VLTGRKAGTRDSEGNFEEGTVNALVDKKLREMADKLAEYFSLTTDLEKRRVKRDSEEA
jgi:hypothetical protein